MLILVLFPLCHPDHVEPHLSHEHHQHIPQQLGPRRSPPSRFPEQLIQDTSCADGLPPAATDQDLEDLRMAIFHIRAERLREQQQQQQQHWMPPKGSQQAEQGASAEPLHHPEKTAVAATLELIHSTLQLEVEEADRARPGLQPREQRNDAAEGPSAPPTGQNNTAEPSQSAESTAAGREETDRPVEGDAARSAQPTSTIV